MSENKQIHATIEEGLRIDIVAMADAEKRKFSQTGPDFFRVLPFIPSFVMHILERQPWAASSRQAVIERCNRIIHGDFIADKDILPRSGPWAHRLVDPHKALRKTTGRYAQITTAPASGSMPIHRCHV